MILTPHTRSSQNSALEKNTTTKRTTRTQLPMTILVVAIVGVLLPTLSGCNTTESKTGSKKDTSGISATTPTENELQLSPEALQTIGLTTVTVTLRSVNTPLQTLGEIKADQNRLFHISAFTPGRIIRDRVKLGDQVRKGQTLAVVQNLDVAKVQANYLHELHQNEIDVEKAQVQARLAQKNLEREKRLLADGLSPRKDYDQAVADVETAQAQLSGNREHRIHIQAEGRALLSAYGLSPRSMQSEHINNGSPVTAIESGIITQKNITVGDMVTADTVLYEVTDLSRLWLDLTVYPADLSRIHNHDLVSFRTDALPNHIFHGSIQYIPSIGNQNTPTFNARAYIDNPQHLLKPGMVGQASVTHAAGDAKTNRASQPFLPHGAIQQYGRESFVFLDLGNGRFRKQTVVPGIATAGGHLLESGLEAGQRVVLHGSFNLKSELLKSELNEDAD
jgi:membrane fusion protein, heavy metal efflux system